jgi:chemotaxis protein MotA
MILRFSAIFGIILALAGISLGLYLDGGKLAQMLQPTAALIVFGGTLGAVIVQFPFAVVLESIAQLRNVFFGRHDPAVDILAQLVQFTQLTRRNGILALDRELEFIDDPFLCKALTLAVDGTAPAELRAVMEIELDAMAERDELLPRVFEAAGGFAPTVGILGAVIGLVQVMQRLENINEVGKGIAVAFVATLYGVGSANLFFLPCAGRIKILVHRRTLLREMMLEGVLAIQERANPTALEIRLSAYLSTSAQPRRIAVPVPAP